MHRTLMVLGAALASCAPTAALRAQTVDSASCAQGARRLLGRVGDGSDAWPAGLRVEMTQPNVSARPSADVASGRFVLCGVDASQPASLTLWSGAISLADTVLPPPALTRALEWQLSPGLFARARDGGALVGRTLSNGAPLSEVDIAIVDGGPAIRSGVDGRFRVLGLAEGPVVVELRHVGFAVTRDTIPIQAGKQSTCDIEMAAVPTRLAAVETTAPETRFHSLGLQDFERRRLNAAGGGHFVGDSVLRAADNQSMTSVLLDHVPGLHTVHYRGQEYVVSGRNSFRAWLLNPTDPRSPKGCFPMIYFDGNLVFEGPPRMPPPLSQFTPGGLSGVEYYSGSSSVPAQFKNLNNPCGALLLWHREP